MTEKKKMLETTEIDKEKLSSTSATSNDSLPPSGELKGASKISIRSDEVQEIISHVPSWMIRWGITLVFVLIVMVVAISWFIKYPDVIIGEATLTTSNPPIRLVAKNTGKITNILMADGATVKKNQVIAEMENPVTQDGIVALENYTKLVKDYLITGNKELPIPLGQHVFGVLQTNFNQLQKNLKDLQELKQNDFSIQKINNLKSKIVQYKKLTQISSSQLLLLKKELKNAEDKYQAEKQLYEKGYSAKMEFYKEETLLSQKQMDLENLKKGAAEQQISLINLEQDLNDTEFQYQENERTLRNNIQADLLEIENGIENWQQNYAFVAPISGKLIWLQKIHQNQYVETGKTLFAITNKNDKYMALATIPTEGFGKIKIGQKARIKLNNYPAYEFGHLEGIVSRLTEIPNENSYQVEVVLLNGITTSYNKALVFTPEMLGVAEIVTEDLRVMQRIFNQFNQLFERKSNLKIAEANKNK